MISVGRLIAADITAPPGTEKGAVAVDYRVYGLSRVLHKTGSTTAQVLGGVSQLCCAAGGFENRDLSL